LPNHFISFVAKLIGLEVSISIVIPCFNEQDFIEKCVRSIFLSEYDCQSIEVLICDGGSSDNTFSILNELKNEFDKLIVLHNKNKTTPYALNLGIENAKGKYVMILGAHSELAPNYLKVCFEILESNPSISCVGGVLKNITQTEDSVAIASAMSSVFGVGNAYFRTGSSSGKVDTVAFGMYRKEVFEKVGLFDVELDRNQDDEFNYRLEKAQLITWLTIDTHINYYVRPGFQKLYRQYLQYGYWKVFVNKKHQIITSSRQLVPPVFVFGIWGGLLLSFLYPFFITFYFLGLLLYFSVAFIFAYSENNSHFFKIIKSFFILHYAYGLGYLKGIIRFYLLNKKPSSKQRQISR
jgi:glycosyltransferase involved in cell wall biosynthesis